LATEAGADREHRLITAGFGGQGVLTLGRILCIAAMEEGKLVTYLPSYGAEVRGGTANCQVVISSHTIYSPFVESADSLIIMNQLSYDRFAPRVKGGGLMLVNSSVVDPEEPAAGSQVRMLALPVTDMAAEMGEVRVANVIMLGAFVTLTDVVGREACAGAMEEVLGKRKARLLDVNREALARGAQLAAEA
jgi:2-oxoglutarate ferredoxin oxidoreductase subunit gamma